MLEQAWNRGFASIALREGFIAAVGSTMLLMPCSKHHASPHQAMGHEIYVDKKSQGFTKSASLKSKEVISKSPQLAVINMFSNSLHVQNRF